jgi:hypothetical protein
MVHGPMRARPEKIHDNMMTDNDENIDLNDED